MMDEDLIQIQTQLAFQDRTIEKLNEVMTAQQRQLDEIEKQIKFLASKLRDVALSDQGESPEPPPPHY
ncbi:MAG: SlyX family protein [Desulfoplanes sp.]|nr:SlyX family protein [Desulfoplanes sp.]